MHVSKLIQDENRSRKHNLICFQKLHPNNVKLHWKVQVKPLYINLFLQTMMFINTYIRTLFDTWLLFIIFYKDYIIVYILFVSFSLCQIVSTFPLLIIFLSCKRYKAKAHKRWPMHTRKKQKHFTSTSKKPLQRTHLDSGQGKFL